MTAFLLKIIACISMLIDHTAYVFEPQLTAISPWLYVGCRMAGRLAFPLFAMGVAEGAARTSSPKKYISRMFLFAIIAQIPFSLMLGLHSPSFSFELFGRTIGVHAEFSVMVTLFLGLVICSGIHDGKHLGAAAALITACFIDAAVGMDYGITGVLLVVGLYLARSSKPMRLLVLLLFSAVLYISPLKELLKQVVVGTGPIVITRGPLYFAATLVSGLLMLAYTGRKGRSAKAFFYLFYPVHMLLLFAARLILV